MMRAVVAWRSGNSAACVHELLAIRSRIYQIGGSNMQRELWRLLLIRAAIDAAASAAAAAASYRAYASTTARELNAPPAPARDSNLDERGAEGVGKGDAGWSSVTDVRAVVEEESTEEEGCGRSGLGVSDVRGVSGVAPAPRAHALSDASSGVVCPAVSNPAERNLAGVLGAGVSRSGGGETERVDALAHALPDALGDKYAAVKDAVYYVSAEKYAAVKDACYYSSLAQQLCNEARGTSSIRQHTSAYVSMRQHACYYSSLAQQLCNEARGTPNIRQHTSAYVSMRQHACYCSSLAQQLCNEARGTPSIRQHTSAYVSMRQHACYCSSLAQQLCNEAISAQPQRFMSVAVICI
jgi:hypothetical protein